MIEIKPLQYDFSALKPVLGPDTLFFHHEKHYAGYVEKANALTPKKWANKSLEEVVALARENGDVALFNQAAQVWNHEFFFQGLSLNPLNIDPLEEISELVQRDFGNFENLQEELIKAAVARFGSGWVWLLLEEGVLKVQTTINAETPCGLKGFKPLWVLDVWEHAYYLDYQNRRADYARNVVQDAINWRVVNERLSL